MILAQAFQRFAFDLDGVIWRGDEAIPGAPETIAALRDAGKRVCFVTNNSSEATEAYVDKLARFGARVGPEDVVTSADGVARLLERTVPGLRGRLALVIGGEGVAAALAGLGVRIAGPGEARDASIVVVGWDRDLTFDKLRDATIAVRAGATFVASNTDATYPAPDGELWPGAGAIVASLRTSTGVEPAVAGKPDPAVMEIAGERLGGPALAIGDRVETDIAAAHAAGWPAALVLTGATGLPDLAVAEAWPDFILWRVSELLEDRPHPQIRSAAGPDLPHIASMLHAGGLMSGAARERIGRTLVAEVDRQPVATAAFEPFDSIALLRSVAVAESVRGAGLGTIITAATMRSIARAGARDVYLVTESASSFFAACGFTAIDRGALPDEIAEHPSVARECSAEATAMRLRLPARA